jgi:hypothetical protein
MITPDPLDRCGRAELPHPTPTLGKDAQAHERIGMTSFNRREPARDPTAHRCRSLGVVRRFRRFYGTVRLPASVGHRRASFDFPIQPAVLSWAGGRGVSRFPHKVLAYLHGSLTAQDPGASCDGSAPGIAFRQAPQRRHPGLPAAGAAGHLFHGSIPGQYAPPRSRFAAALASGSAGLGAVVGRYTFNVGNFHSQHLAGLTGAQSILESEPRTGSFLSLAGRPRLRELLRSL